MPNTAIATPRVGILGQSGAQRLAQRRLAEWAASRTRLSYVYARSLGGLLEVGCGVIATLGELSLQIKTDSTRLVIVTKGARLGTEPQLFFGPGLLTCFPVDGVSLQLESHDWLFFSDSTSPDSLLNIRADPPKLAK